jgi:hypothetical protein
MAFITVPFTSNAETLADDAIDRLAARWIGWSPSDGDMEVIQIEALASMAQTAVEVAATVPDAIFRGFGTSILGVPYDTAQPAVGQATFTAIDTAGYTSDTTTVEIAIAGTGFATDVPLIITPGTTTKTVNITALVPGAEGNGLSGAADLMSSFSWLVGATILPTTQGGEDAQSDADYLDTLRQRLVLQATTLVTGRDFELMALQVDGVGRALAIVGTARAVTVAVANDVDGLAVAAPIKTQISDLFAGYRQVNTTYSVIDATYTTIAVTFVLVSLPGVDPAALAAMAVAAVTDWLDPRNWGAPQNVSDPIYNVWLNETKVRYSELQRVLSVPGTRYVETATLNGGTVDVTLTGTAPLTRPGTITGSAHI